MKKTYLTSHSMDRIQPLNSGFFHFTLKLKVVWFWGLFTTHKNHRYEIPERHDFESHIKLWDSLIKTQKEIN